MVPPVIVISALPPTLLSPIPPPIAAPEEETTAVTVPPLMVALIDEQVVSEIFEGAQKESKVLSMFRRLPNMSSDKTKLRVSDALPVAYFVDESTNNGRKNLTKAAWKNVFLTAEEIAVIVPIKENLLNDASVDLWAEIKPQLTSAIAKTIDAAVFRGEGAPTSWGQGIIPQIIVCRRGRGTSRSL